MFKPPEEEKDLCIQLILHVLIRGCAEGFVLANMEKVKVKKKGVVTETSRFFYRKTFM